MEGALIFLWVVFSVVPLPYLKDFPEDISKSGALQYECAQNCQEKFSREPSGGWNSALQTLEAQRAIAASA